MNAINDVKISKLLDINKCIVVPDKLREPPISSDYDYTASVLEAGLKPLKTNEEKLLYSNKN